VGYDHVILRANRDYKAGEELTYSIGSYLNHELIYNFGILPTSNPNEFFPVFPQTHNEEWYAVLRRHFILFSTADDDTHTRNMKDVF